MPGIRNRDHFKTVAPSLFLNRNHFDFIIISRDHKVTEKLTEPIQK